MGPPAEAARADAPPLSSLRLPQFVVSDASEPGEGEHK